MTACSASYKVAGLPKRPYNHPGADYDDVGSLWAHRKDTEWY